MRKILIVLGLCIAITSTAFAQRGAIGINLGIEGVLPFGFRGDRQFDIGMGGSIKAIYGVDDVNQITVTAGYDTFKATHELLGVNINYSQDLISILAGYRLRFPSLYVEPQVGPSFLKSIREGGGEAVGDRSSSSTNLSLAIGGGYMLGPLDLGIRYQNIQGNGGNLDFIALRIAYGFSL